jgi:hypothetical protein
MQKEWPQTFKTIVCIADHLTTHCVLEKAGKKLKYSFRDPKNKGIKNTENSKRRIYSAKTESTSDGNHTSHDSSGSKRGSS